MKVKRLNFPIYNIIKKKDKKIYDNNNKKLKKNKLSHFNFRKYIVAKHQTYECEYRTQIKNYVIEIQSTNIKTLSIPHNLSPKTLQYLQNQGFEVETGETKTTKINNNKNNKKSCSIL